MSACLHKHFVHCTLFPVYHRTSTVNSWHKRQTQSTCHTNDRFYFAVAQMTGPINLSYTWSVQSIYYLSHNRLVNSIEVYSVIKSIQQHTLCPGWEIHPTGFWWISRLKVVCVCVGGEGGKAGDGETRLSNRDVKTLEVVWNVSTRKIRRKKKRDYDGYIFFNMSRQPLIHQYSIRLLFTQSCFKKKKRVCTIPPCLKSKWPDCWRQNLHQAWSNLILVSHFILWINLASAHENNYDTPRGDKWEREKAGYHCI